MAAGKPLIVVHQQFDNYLLYSRRPSCMQERYVHVRRIPVVEFKPLWLEYEHETGGNILIPDQQSYTLPSIIATPASSMKCCGAT